MSGECLSLVCSRETCVGLLGILLIELGCRLNRVNQSTEGTLASQCEMSTTPDQIEPNRSDRDSVLKFSVDIDKFQRFKHKAKVLDSSSRIIPHLSSTPLTCLG